MNGRSLQPFEGGPAPERTEAAWHERRERLPADGPEPGVDPRVYLQVFRNHWRLVAAVFAVVVAGVTAGTMLQRPVYRATGMLELRNQTGEGVSVEALLQPGRSSTQYLETQYGLLRSPALAARVSAELRGTPGADEVESSADVQRALTIDPLTGSSLIRVSFEAHDPQVAARGVNAVFNGYLQMRILAGQAAERRLAHEVDSIRAALTDAEGRLQEYARASGLTMLAGGEGEGGGDMAGERLRRLQQQLTEAEAERYQHEAVYNLAQREDGASLDSEALQALSVRIADLSAEYARLRSTFTESYPQARQIRNQLDELERLRSGERRRASTEIRNAYLAAVRREGMLRSAFEEQKRLVDQLGSKAAEYRILQRDVEGHQQLYTVLQQKQKAAGVSAALAATEVNVVEAAAPPRTPVRPSLPKNLALAVVLGLFLGLGAAVLREYTHPLVRTVDEAAGLAGVPVLGMIPETQRPVARIGSGRRVLMASTNGNGARGWPRIDHESHRGSPLAEAFAGLRTSVLWDLGAGEARSILVTSSQPQEGKTTVAVNLAISLGRLGKRVLVVDADLRRPSMHRALGVAAAPGLSDYLAAGGDWRRLVRPGVAQGVDLLTSGRPPQNPAELISSDRMRMLVGDAETEYDFVVLDSAALLINAPDARVVAEYADGVLLVARSEVTPRDVLARVTQLAPRLLGVVLNGLRERSLPYYYTTYTAAAGD